MDRSFLLLAARATTEGSLDDWLASVRTPIDVPEVLAVAAQHRLTAFAVDALRRASPVAVDAVTRADLHERAMRVATANLMTTSNVGGGVVAVMPAIELLLNGECGYELPHPLPLVSDGDAQTSGSVACTQHRFRVLKPEERLVRLALGAAGRKRLDYALAAGLIARSPLDWDAVDTRAAALGASELLAFLLNLVHTYLGGRLPAATPAVATPARRARAQELWIGGFPSPYGGADTELDHQIDLLRARDVAVHLVPMFGADDATRASVLERGCEIHEFRPDIFRDRIVASFCNGQFLQHLPAIIAAGRPAKVIWFNCMTWLFPAETDAHKNGWIDLFGFQSRYQRQMLMPQLEQHGPVRTFPYKPFFNTARVSWQYREWNGVYAMGRISRDDMAKFAPDTWAIFDRVETGSTLRKKVYVLGYGEHAARQIGSPPAGMDCTVMAPGAVSATEFYRSIDTLVHKTGGSRENYPRVLVEAYAHGVVPVVERNFGFPELVVHGETGFMSNQSDEMSEYATRLAADPALHRWMAENGRRHLETVLTPADACWQGWEQALAL